MKRIVVLLLVSGCATNPTMPDAQRKALEKFDKDRKECAADPRERECLHSRGYQI